MKRYLLCLFTMLFAACHTYAQDITQAQAMQMAARIRTMTPQQILKFKDSLMNAVLTKQAKTLPNGAQLLQAHHYDTTFTTVSFSYSKKTTGRGGTSFSTAGGTSSKAVMLYEANGHTIIQCSFNPHPNNIASGASGILDKTAAALKSDSKYMTPGQQTDANDQRSIASFSSLNLKDNSLKASASHFEGNVVLKSIDNATFSFTYDPVEHISSIGAGVNVTLRRTILVQGVQRSTDEVMGIGCLVGTDPSLATIAGGGHVASDPKGTYAVINKTSNGFKITYTKISGDAMSSTVETLSATVGEPILEYEAVIKPYNFNYEHWLPKGPKVDGSDDKKGDDSSRFYIFIQDKTDPTKLYPGNYTVKWSLKNVTRYPGICSNYPLLANHPDREKDLKISDSIKTDFYYDSSTVNDSLATTKTGNGMLAVMRVMCLDYGAWGKLYAEVTLDDGEVLKARPYYKRDGQYITIPFDEDENKIADAWEAKEQISHKGYKLDWDEDVKPDNGNNGDDISLIDEYRGFLTEDDNYKPVYTRFSPGVKELITIGLADKSNYGETYKAAIKRGALGYGHVTSVKVYHLTSSKYGEKEQGVNIPYGRWVNWNSPLPHHTDAVLIYAEDQPNAAGAIDPEKKQAVGSTGPIFDMDVAGYTGAQVPALTDRAQIWVYDIVHSNEMIVNAREWYLPKRPEGNDRFNRQANQHVLHANRTFHMNFDTLTLSNIVDPQAAANIARLIAFTTAHEICHATNIHHHHLEVPKGAGYYLGVSTCPMRYWYNPGLEDNHADWLPMFFTGTWDPGTLTTPYGMSMTLCKTDDDCFHQLKLKK